MKICTYVPMLLPDTIPIKILLETHPAYNPRVSTPSGRPVGILTKYSDLYEGGEVFENNKNLYLRKRQADAQESFRAARLAAAHYTGQVSSLIDWLSGIVFQSTPEIESADAYWMGLNVDADGTGKDLAAVAYEAILESMIHKRSYLVVDFPGGGSTTLADAKRRIGPDRAPLDAMIVAVAASVVDDWDDDARGEMLWARMHTVESNRDGVGQSEIETHTWTYITPEGKREYKATKKTGEEFNADAVVAGAEPIPHDYGGRLPIVRIDIPKGLWVMHRLESTQLQIFNADASLAFLYDTNCFQMPVIKSARDFKSIVMTEINALKLDPGEDAIFLAPSGTPFEQLRQYIDKLESRLYLMVQAMGLQAASKDEHGRQSGVAKQRDMAAAHTLMACYRGRLKDALLKAFAPILHVRKDDPTSIILKGLDNDHPDEMKDATDDEDETDQEADPKKSLTKPEE